MFQDHLAGAPRLSSVVLIAATLFGLYLCYLMAAPFLPALVWGFVLAILAEPVDARLRVWTGARSAASAASVALVAALVVFPALFIATTLLSEAVRGAAVISSMLETQRWAELMRAHPWIGTSFAWIDARFDMENLLQSLAAMLGSRSAQFLQGSITGIVNLLLTFYFLFYLLRDRERVVEALRDGLPLSELEFDELAGRIGDTVYATVYGTAAVAALQGALGGVMFWWLALPAPIFWGVLMGLLGVVPFLGAFVVWAPAAAYLALSGDFRSAAILGLWGAFVVGLADNFVYPILVGRRLMLHTMVSFIAVVGGLFVFGAMGIVLGPLVVTMLLVLMRIWRRRSALPPAGGARAAGA